MALLKFLKGNYSGLSAKAISEGQVLICGDTGEMFVDIAADKRIKIGDFIVVSTLTELEALDATAVPTSRLYYVEDGNILARSNGTSWTQINKQKTLAELGGVALGTYTEKIALLEKADNDNATAIAGVDTRLQAAEEKLKSVATTEGLSELTDRVTAAEGEIDVLQAAIAEGGSVANAIKAAQDTANSKATLDQVKALDYATKTEAQGYANAKDGAIAEAQAAGDNAQADVDALKLKVGTVADGKTVVGLIGEVDTKAGQGVSDAAAAQAKADSAYALAEGKATMEQVNAAISGAGHAVKSEVDTAIDNLDKAYKAADTALETKLQGNIDKKVDQTAYDNQVAALAGADTTLQGNIDAEATARANADTALSGRITTLEGQITGLSGAMHFKGVKSAIPTDVTGYADGDVIIVGDKEYVYNGGSFVEFGDVSAEGDRISALEVIVGEYDDEGKPVDGLVKDVADNAAAIAAEKARAEAKEATLVKADEDNLKAAKKYTDDEIAELNISQYAKQADLDTHTGDEVAHITATERTAWNAAESNAKTYAKDYADGLNAGMNTRVEALEAIDHTHANKEELDLIASGDKAKWDDAYAKRHEHANKTVLDGITSTKVSAWDAAEANAKAYADTQVEAAKTDASNKDAVVLAEAQKGIAAAKTELQGNIDTVSGALNTYKTNNDAAVALKANAADVYTKDQVEVMLTWGEF